MSYKYAQSIGVPSSVVDQDQDPKDHLFAGFRSETICSYNDPEQKGSNKFFSVFRIRIRPDPKFFGLKDPDPK